MNLKILKDTELVNSAKTLVGNERNIIADFLLHLVEIEERGLHLSLGYSSLFDYLTTGLKFSKSGAGRRVAAARCIRENPEVESMLRSGELNLSTVCEVTQAVKEDKAALKRFSGVSKREAQAIAAEYKPAPKRKVKDSIKPLGRRAGKPEPMPLLEATPTGGSRGINDLAPAKHKVSFEANAEFVNKLEEVKAVLSNKLGAGASLEEVLGACMEICLEKHCPKRKEARRVKRQDSSKIKGKIKKKTRSKSKSKSKSRSPTSVKTTADKQRKSAGGRYIPAQIRREVMRRDQYQCSYIGADGKRCGCRKNLQIDHIVAFAVGGKSELENLRVLCRAHNQLAARQAFGQGVVNACIQRAKAA